MFNRHAYSCDDAVRWPIWDDSTIEPWYRQNMFIAQRDPVAAGGMPIAWYPRALFGALAGKLFRVFLPRRPTAEGLDACEGARHG